MTFCPDRKEPHRFACDHYSAEVQILKEGPVTGAAFLEPHLRSDPAGLTFLRQGYLIGPSGCLGPTNCSEKHPNEQSLDKAMMGEFSE